MLEKEETASHDKKRPRQDKDGRGTCTQDKKKGVMIEVDPVEGASVRGKVMEIRSFPRKRVRAV